LGGLSKAWLAFDGIIDRTCIQWSEAYPQKSVREQMPLANLRIKQGSLVQEMQVSNIRMDPYCTA
jgi:hypothetical protein